MEGLGSVQPGADDACSIQFRQHVIKSVWCHADHGAFGRVVETDPSIGCSSDYVGDTCCGGQRGDHDSGRLGLHEKPTFAYQTGSVLRGPYSCQGGCGQLADAVSEENIGDDTEGFEDLCQRELGAEKGEL